MNSKKPFFSVVIPTYNQSTYLKKSIESVMMQKFKDYEIIVIDNNSKDLTEKVTKSFKSKKIIYRKTSNEGNIAKSRNIGIKISKGKWIALLDSDDFWYKNKLQSVYKIIKQKNEIDVICNDKMLYFEGSKKKKIYSYGPYKKNFYKYMLKYGNRVSTSASVVKKDFLKKNFIKYNENKKFISTEDYEFFLNIARKNGKFYFYHKVLGCHLMHNMSASANYYKHQKALKEVCYYHAFSLQKFDSDKKGLWKHINFNITFKDMIYNLKTNKFNYKVFKKIIKLLTKSPISFFKLFFIQFYRSSFKTKRFNYD